MFLMSMKWAKLSDRSVLMEKYLESYEMAWVGFLGGVIFFEKKFGGGGSEM